MDKYECFVNFLKGMIGPGVLTLPLSFKQAGFIPASIMIFVIGLVNCYCMYQLVECSRYFITKYNLNTIDYATVSFYASNEIFKKDSKVSKILPTIIWISLFSLQIGICSVFHVFVGSLSKELFEKYFINIKYDVRMYYLIYLFPFAILVSFKSIRTLTILNLAANLLLLISLLSIFLKLSLSKFNLNGITYFTNINGLFTALGAIMYAFEGQALVIPLMNHMKEPKSMIGLTGVLPWVMITVIIIAECSGIFGYLVYGDKVSSNIMMNLEYTIFLVSIKIIFTIVVFVSYLIQMFVPIDMMMPYIENFSKSKNQNINVIENIVRILFVILTTIISISIPNLNSIISLIGVTCGMLLALICPAIIHTFTFLSPTINALKMIVINMSIVILGSIGIIFGLKSTIEDMIQ